MGSIVTVRATRGKSLKIFEGIKEAAYAFNCSPNSIKFASDNCTAYQGWHFKILRNNVNRCVSCDSELQAQTDDYCSRCYYEELTGKSYLEQQKIGPTKEPNIMYSKG